MTRQAVVVLGGAGSVGRALLAHLEHQAVVVDRVELAGATESYCVDVTDIDGLEHVVERLPDRLHVVHLAANLDNDRGQLARTLGGNLLGVSAPLAVLAPKIAHITYVSSISVYGNKAASPIREDAPLAPVTPYAVAKAAGETLVAGLGRLAGIPVTIIRPAQLFGLASAAMTLPHRLLAQMRAGERPMLGVPPGTRRDYLWVGDLVDLLVRQVEQPTSGVFNIGSGAPVTLAALFAAASARFGIDYLQAERGGSFDQWLDIERARTTFGFVPRWSVLNWLSEVDPECAFDVRARPRSLPPSDR